jgi:hypothetical protein
MKKILIFLIALLLTIIFTGCNNQNTISMISYEIDEYEVNDYSDANMTIIEETISNKELTIELNYFGKDEGRTGAWYTIFVYEENEWNEMSYIIDGNIGWVMIAYIVKNNQASQMSINWEWLYGELSTGRYLIVKQFTNYRGPDDFDNYYLACEFTII